nr:uncharacterized protein LOC116433347 [Nomia melanderi]
MSKRIPVPKGTFRHVHIDLVGSLRLSDGHRYCLATMNRFSQWPKISRFGAPLTTTTGKGSQFKSQVFTALPATAGFKIIRTSAYHPASNGLLEHWHRSLKTAIRCQENKNWTETLPAVLLGSRTACKEDIEASTAELVHGETLCLPGEFFIEDEHPINENICLQKLQKQMKLIKPIQTVHHSENKVFIHANMYTCTYVFLRVNAIEPPLALPHEGPYPVMDRFSEQLFIIKVNGQPQTVSIERVKPVFTENTFKKNTSQESYSSEASSNPSQHITEEIRTYPGSKQKKIIIICNFGASATINGG